MDLFWLPSFWRGWGRLLILVLMEDTLGDIMEDKILTMFCLNPCSNGRYSRSKLTGSMLKFVKS